DVGTAGSIPLILQVLIPAVSLLRKKLRISITGGTDVPWSPTSNYTKFVLGEAYSRIGIGFSLNVKRRGYYPKGRGLIEVEVTPAKNLIPISLTERTTRSANFLCSYSKLSQDQIHSEIDEVRMILEKDGFQCNFSVTEDDAIDKGCSFLVFSHDDRSIVGTDAIYEKSLNGIGKFVANKFIETNHGVDLFLSDMLVVPLSLIKDTSVFRVKQITKHLETNLFVAAKMTGCRYGIGKVDDGFEVRISGISDSRMQ
ncbi:MAG TPA: RNA 3'-terminal phosphate cyclase, partial [Candidatus Bathyarchaeia archaeon]|nr:RNA 3'-terminal phosphate cyclase [Candidatus Bathyarchaeia archaeon]